MAFVFLLLGISILPLIFKSNKIKIIFFISLIIFIISIFALNEKNKVRMYDNFINIIKFGVYHDDGTYFKTKNNFYVINSGWGAHWFAAKNIFIDAPIIGKGLRSFLDLFVMIKNMKLFQQMIKIDVLLILTIIILKS